MLLTVRRMLRTEQCPELFSLFKLKRMQHVFLIYVLIKSILEKFCYILRTQQRRWWLVFLQRIITALCTRIFLPSATKVYVN